MVSKKIFLLPILASPLLWLSCDTLAYPWNPILGIGYGTAIISDLGESQSFPIQTPLSDEFYNYTANQSSQHVGLYHGFIGVEWPLQTDWAFQTGLHYFQTASLSTDGTLTQGAADAQSANSYSYSYDVISRQLLIEGKLLYTIKKRFHPYVMVGLGTSFNRAYNYSTNVPSLTFTRMYADNTANSFSYALGIGFDTNINSHLRFGASYRFTDLGQVELGNATIDTTSVSGTLSQSHLYANEILGQLTWVI